MASSSKALAALGAGLLALASVALGADRAVTQRFLSFVTRDMPPTVEEAKALQHGSTTIETQVDGWLGSEAHKERIYRYFNDMFGVRYWVGLAEDAFTLEKNAEGVYRIDMRADCTAAQAVAVPAWWTDGGTVLMCPNSVNADIKFVDGATTYWCTRPWWDGIQHAGCGCGPQQTLCLPKELMDPLRDEIRYEFARRGTMVYEKGMSWGALFADGFAYGNRLLYWYYMFQQRLRTSQVAPTATELESLAAIPLATRTVWSPLAGVERAGIVTMPGFLKQFNNFRSRVRGLTQRLLCQDVDATLNTDNIAIFRNPDLDPNDLLHGHKPGCEGCHYPMDNAGSTLLPWDQNGDFRQDQVLSVVGHIFGEDGEGPGFLIRSYVERHPQFLPCMAKRAWEDLSGKSWANLSEVERASFAEAAAGGPQAMFHALFKSEALRRVPGGED